MVSRGHRKELQLAAGSRQRTEGRISNCGLRISKKAEIRDFPVDERLSAA